MALGLLAISALLGGCGQSNPSSGDTSESKYADEPWLEKIASSDKVVEGKTEPEVTLPDTPPPTKLKVRDIEVGKGPTAKPGDIVKLEYVGINWNDRPYTDSWTYPEVPRFQLDPRLGEKHLVYGLDLGVRGMKAGGRREVIVPSNLLAWPDAQATKFSPYSSVIFVVDVFEVRSPRSSR